jgi:hypothetical protein
LAQGALPDAENVVPATHATAAALHTRSFVTSHSDLVPSTPHVDAAVHAVHGALPDAENVVPATQAGAGVLHAQEVAGQYRGMLLQFVLQ